MLCFVDFLFCFVLGVCQIRTYLATYILQSLLSVCVCVCVCGSGVLDCEERRIFLGFGGGDGLRGFCFYPSSFLLSLLSPFNELLSSFPKVIKKKSWNSVFGFCFF